MHRCDSPAGEYEVAFVYASKPYGEPRDFEFLADIGEHVPVYGEVDGKKVLIEDIPRASQSKPYVGELCTHELEWLSYMPGFTYARHRRYSVRRLDDPATEMNHASRARTAKQPTLASA